MFLAFMILLLKNLKEKSEFMKVKCKICGESTTIIYDKQFDIEYHKCKSCDFIHIDADKIVSFDSERAVYDLHENSIDDDGYVNYLLSFFNTTVLPFRSSGKGLDFGSGPSPVLSELIMRDYDFDMDIYDLHYQTDKIYEGKKYDLITSTEVIEHLSDPLEVFKLFSSLLNVGGVLAIMTLFHYNDETRFLNWWYRRDETHISFYNLNTLESISKLVGLELIYTDSKRYCTFRKL